MFTYLALSGLTFVGLLLALAAAALIVVWLCWRFPAYRRTIVLTATFPAWFGAAMLLTHLFPASPDSTGTDVFANVESLAQQIFGLAPYLVPLALLALLAGTFMRERDARRGSRND